MLHEVRVGRTLPASGTQKNFWDDENTVHLDCCSG